MGTDWQLGLFHFGIAACVALLVFVVTQFDIENSISAIWNHNRTAQKIAAVNLAAETRQNARVTEAKKKTMEYPSDCYSGGVPQREPPGDVVVANLEGFIASSLALLGAVVLVIFLESRMGRMRKGCGRASAEASPNHGIVCIYQNALSSCNISRRSPILASPCWRSTSIPGNSMM